ncbi:histidine kinase [Sphingobacterium arenae]|uniref:Histidine kinase n=1 Tax=Sphingobacterium arenae TaxID=1280598 RepID=A0ABR7Y2X9_9SPHI|nr:histidine kinase [Sphingobacterium arenae]MBD1425648.1 histidine kinase [Sphingobacterium arenae]
MTCSRSLMPVLAIIFIIALYSLMWNVNAKYVEDHIPHRHIAAVVLLYAAYYSVHLLCFDMVWKGGWARRIIGVVGITVLYWTLFPVMYKLIQEWMPAVGLQLFDDTVPYNEADFRKRLISPYIIVVSMAAFTVAITRLIQHHFEKRQLLKKLTGLQQQFIKREIKTHFISNILSTNIGAVLLDSKPDQKKKIIALIELLAYFNKVDQGCMGLVSLKEELRQLKHFIAMINQQYGEGAVICTGIEELKKSEDDIPLGLLLLPLENCLKYARLDPKFPIMYSVRRVNEGWVISCVNYMDWKRVETTVRTGTGMEMAEKQIAGLGLPIQIAVQQDEEKFFFTININKL